MPVRAYLRTTVGRRLQILVGLGVEGSDGVELSVGEGEAVKYGAREYANAG